VADNIERWESELAVRDRELQDQFWKAVSGEWSLVRATGFAMRDAWELQNDLQWLRKRLRARRVQREPLETNSDPASTGNVTYPHRIEFAERKRLRTASFQRLKADHAQLKEEGTAIALSMKLALKKAFSHEVRARGQGYVNQQ
jgi:hypothetical protein